LKVVYSRLSPGGICVIDDYGYPHTPGVKIAVDEFMKDKKEKVDRLYINSCQEGQAVFIKI
jgi:hypothetical protein